MSEADWLALCVYMEARGEIADGRAAVARVIVNRARLQYASTGTIESTVTWPSQFSWCEYAYVSGRYERVCSGPAQIRARAQRLLAAADAKLLTACRGVAQLVQAGKYRSPAYDVLTDDTVLYVNLALASPSWALKVPRVATIGHQAFYRDPKATKPGVVAPRSVAALA